MDDRIVNKAVEIKKKLVEEDYTNNEIKKIAKILSILVGK